MRSMKLFIILSILGLCQTISAKDLDTAQIRSAVQTWVRYITANAQPNAEVYALEPYLADSDTFLYVAHLKPRGFCICGAKYYMLPVYLYSPWGSFNENEDDERDDHIRIIGQSIVDEFQRILKENPSKITNKLLPTRRTYWEMLSAGIVPPKSKGFWDGPDSMSLAEVPKWYNHQWYPFNAMAPKLAGAVCTLETPDGCVAHSMARIMRYWRWPYSGTGTDTAHFVIRRSNTWQQTPLSFNPFPSTFDTAHCPWKGKIMWVSTGGGRLMMKDVWDEDWFKFAKKQCKSMTSAESTAFLNAMDNLWALMTEKDSLLIDRFDTVVYRWDLMPSEIGDIDSLEEKVYAVSKLTYNCGQAVHMYYGTRGSSAGASPEPYEAHFYYDTDAEWVDLPRCDGPDTCNCPDDWHDPPGHQADDTCNCPEPDTCSGAKALVDEIQWLRPVQFAQGPYVGHAWVVWGYNRLCLPDEMQFFQDDGVWCTMSDHIIGYGMVRRIAPLNYVKFVGATTTGDGSPANPYRNIEDAIAGAPNGATLIFKAGSTNLFNSSSITIDRPMILKGRNATIKRSY